MKTYRLYYLNYFYYYLSKFAKNKAAAPLL